MLYCALPRSLARSLLSIALTVLCVENLNFCQYPIAARATPLRGRRAGARVLAVPRYGRLAGAPSGRLLLHQLQGMAMADAKHVLLGVSKPMVGCFASFPSSAT